MARRSRRRGSKKKSAPDAGAARAESASAPDPAGSEDGHRVLPPLLLGVALLVYQPMWSAGFIWDDDAHITPPQLRSLQGLARIWFEPGTTQQYYPLTESLFWLQYRLWGEAPLGYHITNILLHVCTAILFGYLLRRLAVPGAFLAAGIFLVHPVHVESVAWITEQKNTLSAAIFMAAAIAYLRFDESRRRAPYLAALGFAVLALLAKIVTLVLPFALLVCLWWRDGKLGLRKHVLPLVPFVAAGIVFGLITLRVEADLERPAAAVFELTLLEQGLLAGRSLWFYIGKLLWPHPLLFFYPRWEIDAGQLWQYLYPAAAVAALVLLWWLRRRTRAPVAALLAFGIIQAPMLGFLDIYAFIYSFVADHWQYLGSTALIALAAGALATALRHRGLWGRPGGHALCLAPLALLALLSFRQSGMYANSEALYRATIAGNPDSWIAHNNLAGVLVSAGRVREALPHCKRAAELMPESYETHHNYARALLAAEQPGKAIEHFALAARLDPRRQEVHLGMGAALVAAGRNAQAIAALRNGMALGPAAASDHYDLGRALAAEGMHPEAIRQYRRALQLAPDSSEVLNNLGTALARTGQLEEAAALLERSLRLSPDPRVEANLQRVRQALEAASEPLLAR
ncbi:MAG: tetratricopeptide repeat protein [Myxococcales bacterium]|nr:tetratricopeptide repeat protein [Myxococcales bacterium]